MTGLRMLWATTLEEWHEWNFIPAPNIPLKDGYFGWEVYQLNQIQNGKRIWTLRHSVTCNCTYIQPGRHYMERIHNLVSEKQWSNDKMKIIDYTCPECREEEAILASKEEE